MIGAIGACASCHEPRTTAEALDVLMARYSKHFARAEPRRMARLYVEALLRAEGRKTATQIASFHGKARADGVQRLLGSARWNADGVRDELVDAVGCRVDHAAGTLVMHHHCFPKRGPYSVGVVEHFCPQSQRIEHSQVAVIAVFEVAGQRYIVDRELFLPVAWAGDLSRRQVAGVPDSVPFRTMGRLAADILRRCTPRLQVRQVMAGRELGDGPDLLDAAEAAGLPCVVELSDAQARRLPEGGTPVRGSGATAWARIQPVGRPHPGWPRRALVRPIAVRPGSPPAALLSTTPWDTPACEVFVAPAQCASALRGADECVQRACDQVGLNSYECRRWVSWYRHVTLSASALFCRAERSAAAPPEPGIRKRRQAPRTAVPLMR